MLITVCGEHGSYLTSIVHVGTCMGNVYVHIPVHIHVHVYVHVFVFVFVIHCNYIYSTLL